MSVLQTTATGASRPVNARRVRGWVRGGAVGIFGLWLFNTLGGDESGPLLDLARLTGLEAGYAVLAALLLMARIPALDRRVGSDQLALLHAWVGRWIVGTAVAHTMLAILGYANLANRGIPGEIADLNTQNADVLLATVALGLFLLVAVTSARAARKRLQYETWHMVHLYTYLAIALSFAHQFSTGADFRYTGARVIWSAMYLAVTIALLRYRVFEPLRVNWRHRLRVTDVHLESPDTVSVYLSGRALDRLDVRPGQFFRWRFATRGLWWTATPYSLSAPASADGLRITARMVGRPDLAPGQVRRTDQRIPTRSMKAQASGSSKVFDQYRLVTGFGHGGWRIADIRLLYVFTVGPRVRDLGTDEGECGRGCCVTTLDRLPSGRSEVTIPLRSTRSPGNAGVNMNKSELIDAISERLGDRRSATEAVNAVLETIQSTVANGDKVAITGFGVFEKSQRAARAGRNPATGAAIQVPASSVPKFRPGTGFKALVNAGNRTGETKADRMRADGTKAGETKADQKKTDKKKTSGKKTSGKKTSGKKARQ